jgi:hypothetical protein
MARKRTQRGRILVTVVVCLLLCGVVVGEFPELLTLTDNATNDFTVVRTQSMASPVLVDASSYRQAAEVNGSVPATTVFFSYLSPLQEATLIPARRSALSSVLRT